MMRVREWQAANINWANIKCFCCRQIWWIVSAATLLSKATVQPLRSKLGVE